MCYSLHGQPHIQKHSYMPISRGKDRLLYSYKGKIISHEYEVLVCATVSMSPQSIMLREGSQTQKVTHTSYDFISVDL